MGRGMENIPELRTAADIHRYIERETARQMAEWHAKSDRIFRAKNSIWLLLLVVVYLEYYLIMTMIQASSESPLVIKLPVGFQQRSCTPTRVEKQEKPSPAHRTPVQT
jgi:ABC-type siderophore export system fused ATPase/permease subunit